MQSTFDRLLDVRDNLPPESVARAYLDYTEHVSPFNMAIGYPTAVYLWLVCCDKQPRTVADFGSGFTSYVLRAWARQADHPVTVLSVDDDEEWLERTRSFCAARAVDTAGMVLWNRPAPFCGPDLDVAVYDYASGDKRNDGMWSVAECMAPGGALLFDDAMHEGHRAAMQEVCDAHKWVLRDLPETKDDVGRYAAMAVCTPWRGGR